MLFHFYDAPLICLPLPLVLHIPLAPITSNKATEYWVGQTATKHTSVCGI